MSSGRSHKTPQLMKLLTGSNNVSNPLLDEHFKQEIIKAQKNPEPVQPRQAAGGTEINITSELISFWVPKVMERFNICKCDRCNAEMTVEAFDRIKPVIVKVKSDADIKRAEKMKSDRQQEVLMEIIKLAVRRKSLKRHDDKK